MTKGWSAMGRIAAFCLTMTFVTGLALADTWVQVGNDGLLLMDEAAAKEPALTVNRADIAGLQVTTRLSGVQLETEITELGEFVQVTWPDSPRSGAIGTPALPVLRRLFVVPRGAQITFEYKTGASVTMEAPAAVMPVQAPIEKLPGAHEAAEFNYDADAYAAGVAVPVERVTLQRLGIVRHQQLYLLEVHPVAYNPAQQTLTFYPEIVADVQFEGGTLPRDKAVMPGLKRLVLNPGLLPDVPKRGEGKLLIIGTPTFMLPISGFASAKQNQGFDVAIHSVAEGTSKESIKDFIAGLYGTAGEPDYILIVGDTDTIPCWVGGGTGSPDTDIQYVCMDDGDDWYPDIPIGRFPVRTMEDLTTMVDKTLYYEAGVYDDPDYLMRAVFMASEDRYWVSEGTHDWVIDTYLDPMGYTYDKLYCHTYSATTQQVRDAFDDGRFFGVYSGHGGTTSWADGPSFSVSDVENLTNENMYSLVFSFACVTGAFEYDECFMETWVLADNGAVASWGSSVNSYWDEDDILEKVLFDSIYDEFDEVLSEVGPILNDTKLRYLEHWGDSGMTRRYFEMYNLMGDPTMWVCQEPTPPEGLRVTPTGGLAAEGQAGGPFTPDSIDYVLENYNETALDYEVTTDTAWLSIVDPVGTIEALGTVTVTVELSPAAYFLGNGQYTGSVEFVNLTDGVGDTLRTATLTIGVPTMQYEWTMDEDPGWDCEGNWAWGTPTGGGGTDHGNPDPSSGHTGENVYGYNLDGDYENDMVELHLTSDPIDCSELTEVSLKFWRHLNVESPTFDHAYVRVSNDGENWETVWENGSELTDSSWSEQTFDIASVADNQATVYVRWTMGETDGSWLYSGWNIDDVAIYGLAPSDPLYAPGDMNCDYAVDFQDINPFILALSNPEGYATAFPECSLMLGDCNDDGEVDFRDINPFVLMLAR